MLVHPDHSIHYLDESQPNTPDNRYTPPNRQQGRQQARRRQKLLARRHRRKALLAQRRPEAAKPIATVRFGR